MALTGLLEVSPSGRSRLSRMADEQVVERAREGSSEAAEHLLRKYRGFVEIKARSYFLAGAEQDDVVQEGMIGLYKAIRDFRSEKVPHFRPFVEMCVTRQIITAVKSATRNKHTLLNDYVSLQAGTHGEDGDGCLFDIVPDRRAADPEEALLERLSLSQVGDSAREELSELEHEVLGRYLDGDSYLQIARDLDRPAKAIDNALQRAKRKVGGALLEAGWRQCA